MGLLAQALRSCIETIVCFKTCDQECAMKEIRQRVARIPGEPSTPRQLSHQGSFAEMSRAKPIRVDEALARDLDSSRVKSHLYNCSSFSGRHMQSKGDAGVLGEVRKDK